MTGVFDLDAVVAEREPIPPFVFRFGGEEYQLPGSPDAVAFALLAKEETSADGIARLLGPDQWSRIQASTAVLDGAAFRALIDAYVASAGLDPGESPASTNS